MCICSLRCAARNAHKPYCHLRPVRFYGVSTLSYTSQDFPGVAEHKMVVLILSAILAETFLILRRIQRDTTINVHRSSCKVPVIPVRF